MITNSRDRVLHASRAGGAVAFSGAIASCGAGDTPGSLTAAAQSSQRVRPLAGGQAAAGLPAIAARADYSRPRIPADDRRPRLNAIVRRRWRDLRSAPIFFLFDRMWRR